MLKWKIRVASNLICPNLKQFKTSNLTDVFIKPGNLMWMQSLFKLELTNLALAWEPQSCQPVDT